MKKSNVYTRTGDAGTTSLVGGTRVSKTAPRLEAYGTIDELNAHIGMLATYTTALDESTISTLVDIQNTLFDIGTILATEPESTWQPEPLDPQRVTHLEQAIDIADAALPRHNMFTLPGPHPASAQAHIARTVARRAERRILALDLQDTHVDSTLLQYINRLSDYLYILSRKANVDTNTPERHWQSPKKRNTQTDTQQ